ncbi:MAG: hypothetical protein C0519_16790, partial [Hyphomicrobium sp.]|nr:hypothetical protein [Hyphomicrobium sp.]
MTVPLVRLGQGAFIREIWPHHVESSFPNHGDPMPATATANPHTLMNQISKGRKVRPRRAMLYGTHGIGKSTFGAMAEKPIFIPTEDGLADIDCESFPLARSLGEVMAALESLYSGDHDYRT